VVLSHLGAVVNFLEGNIRRAPGWVQKVGMEWVWRILEEPNLWKRYFSDGIVFFWLFLTKILPLKCLLLSNRRHEKSGSLPILKIKNETERTVIFMRGASGRKSSGTVRAVFTQAQSFGKDILLDLSETEHVSNVFLGELLSLWKKQKESGRKLQVHGAQGCVEKTFGYNGVAYLLEMQPSER
jgi:N-acetylglucosaminyldiphosphoundecaprenol N-acetyl-beta-D-mannosaminyltransferase